MTTVSVVIINYNYARFLEASISSVVGQTHESVEIIVVDDASTDNSREVIERFGSAVRSVYHSTNLGQGAAVNSGATAAVGDLVWFLDADDALFPDSCARAVAAYEQNPTMAKFHGPIAIADRNGTPTGRCVPSRPDALGRGDLSGHVLRYRNTRWPPMSGNAFPAAVLGLLLPMSAEIYRQAADSYLCEQAPLCGPVVRSERPVCAYRIHGRNQFANRPVSVEWLRTKLERERYSHSKLGELAEHLGVKGFDPDPNTVRDVAFHGYRLASLRLDGAGHVSLRGHKGDRRWSVAGDGLVAAWSSPHLRLREKLKRALWFASAALVPRWSVGRLFSWYLPDGPQPPIWSRRTKPADQEEPASPRTAAMPLEESTHG